MESSDSIEPPTTTKTSDEENCAKHHKGMAKKQNGDHSMMHIGADISAYKSDETKVRTDKKGAISKPNKNDDEMILDRITVKPTAVDVHVDITSSSPSGNNLAAGNKVSPKNKKMAGLIGSDIPPSPPDYTPVDSGLKRKLAASMAGSLFDEIHSPSPTKRRIFRRYFNPYKRSSCTENDS